MMAITSVEIITFLALVMSIASLALVIMLITMRRRLLPEYHNEDNDIEVAAVVSEFSQRMKKLEEGLVDQKVKLEILGLRVDRTRVESHDKMEQSSVARDASGIEFVVPTSEPTSRSFTRIGEPTQTEARDRKIGSTELEALRLVYEAHGKATAKEIQQRIGRTREHTARMMNTLFQGGLVERDVSIRPFSYSITQRGRELLGT